MCDFFLSLLSHIQKYSWFFLQNVIFEKHKSCVIPLFKTLQWISIALGMESKSLLRFMRPPCDQVSPSSLSSSRCWPLTHWCPHPSDTLTSSALSLALSQRSVFNLKSASCLELNKQRLNVEWMRSLSLHPYTFPHLTPWNAWSLHLGWLSTYISLIIRIIDFKCAQLWFKQMFIHNDFQRTLILHLLWLQWGL